jgi:hypothetical protein
MAKSKCQKIVVAAALLVVLAAASPQAESAAPSSDELLKMLPADGLFCVRINNFDFTFGQIDQFLAGVSPVPMGLSMMVRMQMAQFFGSPQLQGIDMRGSFAFFGALAPGESIGDHLLSVLIPVTDYKQFVSGNTNVGQPDEKGVSEIANSGGLVIQVGNFALFKPPGSYDRLIALAKSIKEGKAAPLATPLDAAEGKQAVEQPIWIYGNIQQLSKTFGPMLFAQIEQMKAMMGGMQSPGMGPIGSPEKIVDVYIKLLETIMKETKSLSIAINPKLDVLNISETITALPGTDMAKMLVADAAAKKDNKLLGYLEDGAMMNMAATVNAPCCKKFYDKFFELFAPFFGDSITPQLMTKMKTLTADAIDSLAGPVAFSFATDAKYKPPFALKYVLKVKDKDKFDKVIQESMQMWSEQAFAGFYKSMGMDAACTIKRGAASYKGVSIDSAKLVIKAADPNAPEAQMIAAMYGDGLDYRWAIVDGSCVLAVGGGADSDVRSLIDQVKAGGPKQISSEMKAALDLLPDADKADLVGTFNYVRILKILPAIMGAMMPVPMPEIDFPTKSNVAYAGSVGNGKATFDVAIPKQHLVEIMAAFQMMMQNQMKMQQGTNNTSNEGPDLSVFADKSTWVICRNPQCKTAYEMNLKEYHEFIVEHADPRSMLPPAMTCSKCGEPSVYRAVKCEKCGEVFEMGTVPADFADRCPKCAYSKIEQDRKRAAEARRKNL